MTSVDSIKERYPLHFFVWQNDYVALDDILKQRKHDLEALDPHGRTPLMLAVTMDHLESARVLLRHSANASFISKSYWSVLQEAISTGDPQLVRLIMVHRDSQLVRHQAKIVTELLRKLRETPDFYIEMGWEFTSWLPLLSRMCPSDVCRVWKSGSNVRIDTNLIGFNGAASWIRSHLSYIFRVKDNEAYMDEVNHTDRTVYRHNIALATGAGNNVGSAAAQLFVREPTDFEIAGKLVQPIFVTYLDTGKIEFEKSKSGILGWRHDRKEVINKHTCQVFCASNVQIVTLRRTEHLTEENLRDLNQQRREKQHSVDESGEVLFPGSGQGNLLTNLLQLSTDQAQDKQPVLDASHEAPSYNPNELTIQDYFNLDGSSKAVLDIGRPKSMTTKVKTFKARLWLCPEFPLSLKDQIIPIIDLMSEYNPYFHKLKEFLTKQIPTGFPLKIEIPLYHVLNACITFGNLHGQDSDTFGVSVETKQDGSIQRCCIDPGVFEVDKGYHVVVEHSPGHYGALDDEDQMVQMAVQRSLIEYGSAEQLAQRSYSLRQHSIVEARADEYVEPEEAWLQQAIAASLSLDGAEIPVTNADEAYLKVLEESRLEQEREELRRKREDEELARVLELSTREK